MIVAKLLAARTLLDRAKLALRDASNDPAARDLSADVSDLATRAFALIDHAVYRTDEAVADFHADLERLHVRVTAFCEANRLHYLGIDSAPTLVMRREDIDALMPPDANAPPPEIVPQLLEAQLVNPDRHDTIPVPPPPETLDALPSGEED